MDNVGKSSAGNELRKKPRRQFQYRAQILTSENGPPHGCSIVDISQRGARIVLDNNEELPKRFLLLLSWQGNARRICRLVWQEGSTAGVEFPDERP
jgi:hypothetical protein